MDQAEGIVAPKSKNIVFVELQYLLKQWKYLALAILVGLVIGYFNAKKSKPVYTATISFVLSSEQKPSAAAGIASQMGLDLGGGPDNIFAGDNFIDFSKSRSLIGKALFTIIDTTQNQSLLLLIAAKHFKDDYHRLGNFGNDPNKFTAQQNILYRKIIDFVTQHFVVVKKDKKLIFYLINASDTDPEIAYNIAKNMLFQTSKYFIETKTRVSRESVRLMKQESDSLAQVLSNIYSNVATLNDRTYNLNPSLTVQRSNTQFVQTKALAISGAYQQVMQNLETAKMSLQKETPLYRIIDMPELPLPSVTPNKLVHLAITGLLSLILMSAILVADHLYRTKR